MRAGAYQNIFAAQPEAGARLSGLRRIGLTLRSELNPTDAEAALTLTKLRMAQANMSRGMRTMPVFAVLCALIHLKWASTLSVGLWLAAFLACLAVRIWGERLMPQPGATTAQIRRAAWLYVLFSSLFIAGWSAQGFLFWTPGEPGNNLVIVVIMLTAAMCATLTAAWLVTPFIQVIVYIGGTALLFSLEGGVQDMILGVLACLYAYMVVAAILQIHGNTSRLLALESEKDALIAELRQSDKAKSEFLANMSHELRTPLNAILGFSEVMKEEVMGPMQSAAYKSYAGDIHSSGQHLLGLVNDILDLAKIESGKLELSDDSFTVASIVDEGFRLFAMQAEQKGISFRQDVDPAILLRWDLRAAKQITINLLSNAVKFTPAGGTIAVRAAMREDGGCYVTTLDSGCGIAHEDRLLVFESFGQGRHDVARNVKGTGLGLAIVKALVDLHGGDIWLDSAPNEGTAITIEVPADRVTYLSGKCVFAA